MKLTMIGAGYVGLVSGACLADVGNEVLCLDLDAARVARLQAGEIPIHEPGLEEVVRRNVEWLTESPVSSINFTPIHALEGTITPQGCAFERHHSGAIELSKADYRLMINGLVETPLVFTYEDLTRFPRHVMTAFCECAANGGMEWGGALHGIGDAAGDVLTDAQALSRAATFFPH